MTRAPERKYLIRKQGCYYRPNERGYTTSAIQAGRYTRDEAEKITHPNGKDGPRDGMSFIHEDELIGIDEDWTDYSALLADRRDPATLAALPEVRALIAAAYEVAADLVCHYPHIMPMTPDQKLVCDLLGEAIRHYPRAAPADATAALAQLEREAEARGRVKGLREAAEVCRKIRGTAIDEGEVLAALDCASAILARAAEIEREAE